MRRRTETSEYIVYWKSTVRKWASFENKKEKRNDARIQSITNTKNDLCTCDERIINKILLNSMNYRLRWISSCMRYYAWKNFTFKIQSHFGELRVVHATRKAQNDHLFRMKMISAQWYYDINLALANWLSRQNWWTRVFRAFSIFHMISYVTILGIYSGC